MQVRFMNLDRVDYKVYKKSIKRVFKHGVFILGKEVEEFEEKIKKLFNRFAVGVSCGTDALMLSLLAYDIGYNDEVIMPNISYIATANAINGVGAKPVFCDVEDDFNVDPKKIENLITNKTKAIIMVHYAGVIGKIDEVRKIAKKHNLILIEDAAQAFFAKDKGRFAGTIGDIGCFSLNPMKVLGAFGEAGMIVTKDKNIYKKLMALRNNGLDENKKFILRGINAKMDALQASILKEKLKYVKKAIKKRQKIVKKYNNAFKNFVEVPEFNEDYVYFTYTIKTEKRDKLLKFLNENGIEARVYHTAISKELPYRDLHHSNLENSLKLSDIKLALPCNEYLKNREIEYVIKKVKEFFWK